MGRMAHESGGGFRSSVPGCCAGVWVWLYPRSFVLATRGRVPSGGQRALDRALGAIKPSAPGAVPHALGQWHQRFRLLATRLVRFRPAPSDRLYAQHDAPDAARSRRRGRKSCRDSGLYGSPSPARTGNGGSGWAAGGARNDHCAVQEPARSSRGPRRTVVHQVARSCLAGPALGDAGGAVGHCELAGDRGDTGRGNGRFCEPG